MSERLSPEARRLVSAGRAGLEPSAADVQRLRGRILSAVAAGAAVTAGGAGAAAASTGGAAAATGSAATAGGFGLVKVVVVAVAVTGASVTGGVLVARRSDPTPVTTVRHETPATDEARALSHRAGRQPIVEPLLESVPDAGPVTSPVEPPRPPRTVPARPSLASEMDLLRRARLALRAGDPRAALEHLERHAEQFPDSPLAPEAAAIRIQATCAIGDRETAGALADQFQRRWPDSPLARRVPHLCGDEP